MTQDLVRLLTLRAPVVTWTIVRTGMTGSRQLRDGKLTFEGLNRALTSMMVRTRHQRRRPGEGVKVEMLTDALSLAEDIDTLEEATARGAVLRTG